MDYEDFVLLLGTDARGATVRVAHSPAGETAPEPLALTLPEDEIIGLSVVFARAAEEDRHRPSRPVSRVADASLAELGDRLFRALFPETVRARYQWSLGHVTERGKGLRLRLELDLGSPTSAQLHVIPWEYLYRSDGQQFLALGRETSIVRHLTLGLPGDRPPASAPLSILVLAGESLADSSLALAQERRELERAWSEPGEVHITLLRDCTLDALREELLAREYHVLHFMGHGGFDPATGEGLLAFSAESGHRVWISGTELAEQLRDRLTLRLIVLNACQTAQANALAPYAGTATALLGAGVPAVIAMQFSISDAAALAFSRAFYRRIARGDSVDSAVTEGRLAIRRLSFESTEWGTPVLFERLTTGRIVLPLPETTIGPVSPEASKPVHRKPLGSASWSKITTYVIMLGSLLVTLLLVYLLDSGWLVRPGLHSWQRQSSEPDRMTASSTKTIHETVKASAYDKYDRNIAAPQRSSRVEDTRLQSPRKAPIQGANNQESRLTKLIAGSSAIPKQRPIDAVPPSKAALSKSSQLISPPASDAPTSGASDTAHQEVLPQPSAVGTEPATSLSPSVPDATKNSGDTQLGKVRFNVRPDDAAVYVDGKYIGLAKILNQSTEGRSIAPGSRSIGIGRPGYKSQRRDVKLQPGESVTIEASLVSESDSQDEAPAKEQNGKSGRPCLDNFSEEGSFFKGRIYRTWQKFSGVDRAEAFKRMAQSIAVDGWSSIVADEKLGVITALNQETIGVPGLHAPLNVVVESVGNGQIRVEAVFLLGPFQSASSKTVRNGFCKLLEYAKIE